MRRDALPEMDRCHAAGGRLIKIHTAIQGVSPDLPQFELFYRHSAELGMVLMFHTGYEHSCTVVSQKFTNPALLGRALDSGATVIAAHCGTCAFFDPEDYYPQFVRMMKRYGNLYGDTAVLASVIRWRSLARLSREPDWLKARILHGSDYPLPPSRLPYLFRTGLFPADRKNSLNMDLAIKQTFDFGPGYASRVLDLLGKEAFLVPRPRLRGRVSNTPSLLPREDTPTKT
jgi:predicted TIM-barrel fold metal-dependent hydrolase